MHHYGMSRHEIAWVLPISAGIELLKQLDPNTNKTPPEKDPATYYEQLQEKWLQQN